MDYDSLYFHDFSCWYDSTMIFYSVSHIWIITISIIVDYPHTLGPWEVAHPEKVMETAPSVQASWGGYTISIAHKVGSLFTIAKLIGN